MTNTTRTDEQLTEAITTYGLDALNTRALQAHYGEAYGKAVKSTNTVWLRKQVAKALLDEADAKAQIERERATAEQAEREAKAQADREAREQAEAAAAAAKGPVGDLPDALRLMVNRLAATTTDALAPFIDGLPASELRPLLAHYGRPTTGSRAELGRRLLAHLTANQAAAPKPAKAPKAKRAATVPTVPAPAIEPPVVQPAPTGRRLPPVGTTIEKRTRDGRVVSCTIRDGGQVEYAGKLHTSISAAGRAAAADLGQFAGAIDGWIWWGIEKRAKAGGARVAAGQGRRAGHRVVAVLTALGRLAGEVGQALVVATPEQVAQIVAGVQRLAAATPGQRPVREAGCTTCDTGGADVEHAAGA